MTLHVSNVSRMAKNFYLTKIVRDPVFPKLSGFPDFSYFYHLYILKMIIYHDPPIYDVPQRFPDIRFW